MQISVIIPIYNAEKHLKKSVLSALAQKETEEIILIEDHSPDNSLKICKALAKKYNKVKLFRHADHQNHGAAASRNLGIQKAKYEYIAFLDADDFYLENRFKHTQESFVKFKTALGVYEPVGVHYYSPEDKKKFLAYNKGCEINRIFPPTSPEELFDIYMLGERGYIHLNGLVVKKQLFQEIGYLDDNLRQMQDWDIILRMSVTQRLVAGIMNLVVAKRGIHGQNRIFDTHEVFTYQRVFHQKWFFLMFKNNWTKQLNRILLRRYVDFHPFVQPIHSILWMRKLTKIGLSCFLMIRFPQLILKIF